MFDPKFLDAASRVLQPKPFFGALVVESDPTVASRMRRILGMLAPGRRVVLVSTRAEAEEMLAALSFDLVFVDMQLYPIGDGASLIADVCARLPRAQIVAMSDTDDQERVLCAFASGATGYLMSEAEDAEIAYALRALTNGGAVLDPRAARHMLAMLAETLCTYSKLELRSRIQATPE
ncbi:response regulator [Variovorax sp. Varisp62]|uniref:response regulator n=1 Tax=Variovorax sp. Varisp62 TaxID=3243049 RepID=UPI0039B6AB1D